MVERRREDIDPDRKQIFVLAKHGVFREALAFILEQRMDFRTAQAGSLDEARRVLRVPDVDPDLVVVDLELPKGNGVELIGEIREMWPRVSVLALTTPQNLKRAAQVIEAGADEVLTTAASGKELLEAVRRLGNG